MIPNDEVDVSTSIGELGVRGGVSKTEVLPSPSTIMIIDVSYMFAKQNHITLHLNNKEIKKYLTYFVFTSSLLVIYLMIVSMLNL